MTLGVFLTRNKWRACISIMLLVILTSLSFLLPEGAFINYFKALFIISFLAVLLTFDSKAWFPFSLTHTEIANLFGISLAISSYRLALNGSFIPSSPIMVLLLIWWVFTVAYTIFAYGKVLAYNGLVERQMGLSFRLTVPIFLFAGWQLVAATGIEALFVTILIGGVVESALILSQLSFPDIWGFQIKLSDRYVGSISNPIPTANFLLMALPLSLLFYQPGFNNMLTFVVSFELIFLGLILTGGRATMLATGVTVFLMSGYIAISHNPIIGLVTIIAPIFIYALTNKGQKYFERVKSSLLRMRQGKESRYLLWKEAIGFAFAKPLLGVGIENVGNLFRQKGSKKMASAMKDRVTDRTHNYFLDLWLEGGLPYLAVFLILCGVAINNYFTSPYPFAAIAIIAFMVDVFFSFPLQINYLTIMLLIACSGGVFAFAFPAWILLFFIPLFAFNYMKALKTNEATRYIQAGLGFLKQNDTYNAFAMFDSALTIAPDEERFYNLIGHLMYDMVGSGPQQISIFRFFSSLLNGKQKLIINNSPGGDKAYAGVGLLNIAIYKANGNEQAKEAALECTELILKKNPNSFCATRIKLILYWHEKEYEKYQKLVERAIYDCIDGNPNNEIDEQNLWNLYFQAAKETNKRTLDGLFLSRCEKGAIKCEKVK